MKRVISWLLLFGILCGTFMGLTSCSDRQPAPNIEDVYDRLVEVIEASHEVNVLLFGAGVPAYAYGDAEDQLIHRYYGVTDNGLEFVTPYAKYKSIEQMQAAIREVYSTEYRQSLFETLFTGYADPNISTVMPARFSENQNGLCQNRYVKPLVEGVRTYDYASMEILERQSHATYLRVAVPSYTEDKPNEWTTVYLSFVYENGDWYLDSPSC